MRFKCARKRARLKSTGFQTNARRDELTKKFLTPDKLRILSVASAITAVVVAVIVSLPSFDAGNVAAQATGPRISKIQPEVATVTVRPGDQVRLSVDVFGLQDAEDNSLGDSVTFLWEGQGSFSEADSSTDDNSDADESVVMYTAPSSPGSNDVTVSLGPDYCKGDDGCSATITVIVRRASPPPPAAAPPVNPSGPIPSVITDASGTAYSTFTPVEGGVFTGESFSISAGAGAIPNGEFIGISVSAGGDADNTGSTSQRYTLGGSEYDIAVVDSNGGEVSSYRLDSAAEVCVPMPDMFRANISDVSLAAVNDDGTLTILQSSVKIAGAGNDVCGAVSSLPATVAVGISGAPPDVPTPVPPPEPEAPATGGWSPSSNAAMFVLLLGLSIALIGTMLLVGRRRATQTRR